jgi:hypothetical protein
LSQISAQITPPEFQCIREDTLFWLPDTNTCGPFVAYQVFFSTSASGPYFLLDSISNKNTLFYKHENFTGDAYYFLLSKYDCPGLSSLPSDTLNNLFEQNVTHIERVSVEGANVHVSWYANTSPQTTGYVIYRNTSLGTIPIDTVYNALEYLDTGAKPYEQVESYYVLAIDGCGNTTTFDTIAHQTILMQTELDFCASHLKLTWTPYQGWPQGIDGFEIWLGIDGAPPQFEHMIGGSDTLAYVSGLKNGSEYCVAMRATEAGTSVASFSNEICLTADVLTQIETLSIANISVNSDQQIDIFWDYNASADLEDISMMRGINSTIFSPINPNLPGQPLDNSNVFTDQQITSASGPYYYQIHSLDQCGNGDTSNTVSSVLLKVNADGGSINLAWSDLYFPGRDLIAHQICRISDGNEILLQTVSPSILNFSDIADSGSSGQTLICYVIKAIHTNSMGLDTLVSYSNLDCANQMVEMYIPNAFVPQGTNTIFKPEILHPGSIQSYRLHIFNRWGSKIFESTSPDIGWNGFQSGELCDPGVYLYLIDIDQVDGKNQIKSGTLHLIR